MNDESSKLKVATARTLKWNTIDRFAQQVLYGITGIVLANVLPQEDFGLVAAILVFQAFGILFVDSGFGAALLQKKSPTEEDYSTVFWFNLMVSVGVYIILYLGAPLIARMFHNNTLLIPLSRVMFLSFILNGLGIVQTNRLMKAMDVKQIAVANLLGLIISGALGIILALRGAGAWALVWQTIALAAIKTGWLWATSRWRPMLIFSIKSLKDIYRIGLGVFSSSFLNTLFLHIYSFVIGVYYSIIALGIYTQADKWSKMGSASLSQIVTATFVPVLSKFQDEAEKFKAMMLRIGRLTGFMTLPFMIGIAAMATPMFHTLFGSKWDEAIPLFRILMVRGVLVIYISLCTNYLLALGYAKSLVVVEGVKDAATMLAIVATLPIGTISALVWGQLGASTITYVYMLLRVRRATGVSILSMLEGMWRYLMPLLPALATMWMISYLPVCAPVVLLLQIAGALIVYLPTLAIIRDPMYAEGKDYIFARFHRKNPIV